jgi:DNA-binding winged helix-turn-helix (wHTH) protein
MTGFKPHKRCRFGSFVLDLEREALITVDDREVLLRPKSFALLRLLAENAGCVLSQDTILDALWPNVLVTENSIAQCIHEIRQALGAEGREMLRTRHRRGYLFTPEI